MGTMIEFARPDGGKTKGYLTTAGQGRPGIVVIQEWWGLNDQICGVVDRFARAGHNALAPDLYKGRFVDGKDFVHNDPFALDEDGHGTHVTGTIAEHVNNKKALTGIAYGVNVMPLRVLDSRGDGDGATLARALRWAANHGADVINMSIEFDSDLRARDIPDAATYSPGGPRDERSPQHRILSPLEAAYGRRGRARGAGRARSTVRAARGPGGGCGRPDPGDAL